MWRWLLGKRALDPVPLVLYVRSGSAAARDVKDEIARARLAWPYSLTEVDVVEEPELAAEFGARLPVLWIGGQRTFEGRINASDFTRRFAELAPRWWRARSLELDLAASRRGGA
jgi:hypothetical protein